MDGVIIDSNPLHTEAWRVYLRRFGLEVEDCDRRMYGRRNDEIVRDFFGSGLSEAEVFEHGAAKERLYRELVGDRVAAHLVPGIIGFLERHRAAPLGVATNAEPANVNCVLAGAGLESLFTVVIDGHQVERPKPDPEIYLRIAELLSVPPENCIVFEDSEAGVQAACAAGARVVGVKTTHHDLSPVRLSIDDFHSADLEPWLRSQQALRG